MQLLPSMPKLYPAPLTSLTSAAGASQTSAYFAEAADGQALFIKHDPSESGILIAEAEGLQALAMTHSIRIPRVFSAQKAWLVLEAIIREPAGNLFWQRLAEGLVHLHRTRGALGWNKDNFIGRMPQQNLWPSHNRNWADFFWQKRLLPQIEELRRKGIWTDREEAKRQLLYSRVFQALKTQDEEPQLMHGDLWSGNILCAVGQEPVLIDPAVYYGQRETDLAMTELFGGFSPLFYQRYRELYPMTEGYEQRRPIYNFYHKLNHANLYGSGFIWDVQKTLLDLCQDSSAPH